MRKWTILDDLHAEYLRNAPHTPAQQRAAMKRYQDALKRRARAERALQKAVELEGAASANLVSTFGRAPLVLGGKTQQPCYTRDGRVYWREFK